jgi:hypothetical protein
MLEVVGVMLDELVCLRSNLSSSTSKAVFLISSSKFLLLMPRGRYNISFATEISDNSSTAAEMRVVTLIARDLK